MKNLFLHFWVRLLCGLLLACVLPALLLPHAQWFPLVAFTPHWNSFFFSSLVFFASMLSMQRMEQFPGNSSLLYGLSISGIWYLLLGAVLLFFRLEYSIVYLTISFALVQIILLLNLVFIRKASCLKMAFIALGRTAGVDKITGVEWVQLERPELPEAEDNITAIVADLHSPQLGEEWQRFLAYCSLQHIPVYNIRQVEESLTGRVKIHHMYENNLGSLLPSSRYMLFKYLMDVSLILISLPFVIPVMIIAAICIKMDDGGSVFFNQERVGYKGKSFLMYKFRSMTQNTDKNKHQLTECGDTRVTRIGKFIRKTRIDELPQFLNVIKGEMSLIGPRADYIKFVENYEGIIPFYRYRNIVKPGISGWAQVNHGYVTSVDDTRVKIEHDFYYIKHFSLWLDILIVFKTIKTMLTGFGAR